MISMGEKLKNLREEKDVPLDVISEKTNLKKDFILALEEQDLTKLPTLIHARGFLKTYVQFLGSSSKEFLDEFDKLVDAKKEVPQNPFITVRKKKESFQKTKTGTNGFQFNTLKNNIFQWLFSKKWLLPVILFCFLIVILGSFLFLGVSWSFKHRGIIVDFFKKKTAVVFASKENKREISSKKLINKETEPSHGDSQGVFSYIPEKDPLILNAVFLEDSWISVKVDGDLLYEGFIKKGMSEKWIADKTLTISANELKHISFLLNGKGIKEINTSKDPLIRIRITHKSIEFE